MEYIWILGKGPVLINKQFLLDIERLPFVYLNNRLLPKDKYRASKELYHAGSLYYAFSKFGNQTMGNMAYAYLQKVFCSNDYYISLEPYSMKIYIDSIDKTVSGVLTTCIFSISDGLCVGRYVCTSMVDLCTYRQDVKMVKCCFDIPALRLPFC